MTEPSAPAGDEDAAMPEGAEGPITEAEAAWLFASFGGFPAFVLAVSGGPDSIALMWLMARWRDSLDEPPKLIAATVDHGLRKGSAREASDVGKLAATLNVEHRTLRWTGDKPETGIQEGARNARYRLLCTAVNDSPARHLVTAHTLDDQAETLLLRIARGSGVSGLTGMYSLSSVPVPVPESAGVTLVRPLLGVPKTRLIATLEAGNVPFVADPSNADPRFARSRMRALMPLLAHEGLTAERLGKLARRVQRIEHAMEEGLISLQTDLWSKHWSPGNPAIVDAERFLDLPHEVGLRLLQRMIALIGNEGPAELAQLEALYDSLREAGASLWTAGVARPFRQTLAGALITLSGTKLTVERAPPRRTG